MLGQNLAILNGLQQSESGHLQRNSEREIAPPVFRLEVRLRQRAVRDGRVVGAAAYGPELMDPAIWCAVRFVLEAYFTHRAESMFEARHHVLPAVAMGNEPELRILCLLGNCIAGIWNEKAARAPQGRLCVAGEALIGIVPCAQSIRICM